MKCNIEFIAATNNAHKLGEIESILSGAGCHCISMNDAGISTDPDENGSTFEQNALIKAVAAHEASDGRAVIADDSGLRVDALNGDPGVYTARYAGEPVDDNRNIDKLLHELDGVPKEQRTACFVSCVCAIMPDGSVIKASGEVDGYIGFEREGNGGFGYDPIFRLPNGRSIATLPESKKNDISHRGRALRKLAFKLRKITKIRGACQ